MNRRRAVKPWLVAIGFLAVAAGCAKKPRASRIPASAAAAARGVTSYAILHADARSVDAELRGRAPMRLRVHAGAGDALQELEDDAGTTTLRTSATRIEVRARSRDPQAWSASEPSRLGDAGDAREGYVVAERRGSTWIAVTRPDAATGDRIATLLAVDVDMAVQGTSVVRGGTAYVQCTIECTRAADCAARSSIDTCPERVATCGACLEQEP